MKLMTHTDVCTAEGAYVAALRGIRATDDFDQNFCECLPWGEIERLSADCIDRPAIMPAGSVYNNGLGAQQRHCYAND